MRSLLRAPLTPLVVFTMAVTAVMVGYLFSGRGPSDDFIALWGFGWLLMLLLWLEADARQRRITPCFDFGWLCSFALPFSLVWYCFRSRGWRGFGILALLGVLWLSPALVAALLQVMTLEFLRP